MQLQTNVILLACVWSITQTDRAGKVEEMKQNELLTAALEYAAQGLAVFPLQPKEKKPITKNGFYSATTDPATIKQWWNEYPAANIGIATGQRSGGLVVVDLDKHITETGEVIEGYDSLREWQNKNGMLPDTAGTITGSGGNHWLFRLNKETGNRTGLLTAVDIRADGGYIVAPPSIHPNGNKYEWEQTIKDYGIADGGDALERLLNEGTNQAQALNIPDIIPEGKRNDILFKIACSLQAKGLTDSAIYNALTAENKERCRPDPLPDKEIDLIIKSALKYPKGKPQQKAEKQQPQVEYKTQEIEQGDDLAKFLYKVQTDIYKPFSTGINFIDALYSGGPEAQTLNVIAAPPACGKTMLCCQIAESIAKQGRPVIYLNLEMSREQLIARTLAARLKRKNKDIPAAEIRRGYKWTDYQRELITSEVELYRQEKRPHYIGAEEIHGADLKNIMEYLNAAAEAATAAGKPAPAVFLDYLHLVKVEGARDLAETIKETCLQLKDGYAVKHNSIVFAILALNRESMKKGGPLTLYSARDSSNIEYTADTFLTIDFQEVDEKRINPETHPEELQELKKNRIWKMTLRQQKDRGSAQVDKQIIDFEPGASMFHDTNGPQEKYTFI